MRAPLPYVCMILWLGMRVPLPYVCMILWLGVMVHMLLYVYGYPCYSMYDGTYANLCILLWLVMWVPLPYV